MLKFLLLIFLTIAESCKYRCHGKITHLNKPYYKKYIKKNY